MAADDVDGGRDEGAEEVRGDAIPDVPQSQSGDVVHHFVRVLEQFHCHLHDLVSDEVEARVGLLEMFLTTRRRQKKPLVDVAPQLEAGVLIDAVHQRGQAADPLRGLAQALPKKPLDVVPEPVPSDLVGGVPLLGQQGAERRKHRGLELRQVHVACIALGDLQHQHIALLLQSTRIRDVGHQIVEGLDHLAQPSAGGETHDGGIEVEHGLEGPHNNHVVGLAVLIARALHGGLLRRYGGAAFRALRARPAPALREEGPLALPTRLRVHGGQVAADLDLLPLVRVLAVLGGAGVGVGGLVGVLLSDGRRRFAVVWVRSLLPAVFEDL
mmetsp:Transcript_11221/g.30001  ORF Transcript_11221/g.30001 Transcript_11221/m.30001 type:complete len:326 (-) Transcript_11221:494-1471(-)